MHILNSLLPLTALNLPDSRPQLPGWQLGQVLQAVVLKPTQGGKAALDIGGNKLQAHSDLPLRSGEVLTVKVEKQGAQTLLRVLNQFQPPQAVQSNALRDVIPKQESLAPLLANLQMLAGKNTRAAEKLPQPWVQLIRQIVQTMPQARQAATPDGLNQAIKQSGNFLENGLSQPPGGNGKTPLPQDMKANLLRLASAISQHLGPAQANSAPPRRAGAQTTAANLHNPSAATPSQGRSPATAPTVPVPAPPARVPLRGDAPQPQPRSAPSLNLDLPLQQLGQQLRDQVESSIARIQLNQLNSLPTDDSPRHILTLELPIRNQEQTDVWCMRLEQELPDSQAQANGAPWTVHLAFEFAGLGPVHARVSLQAEAISANFWAEQDTTAQLIETHLAQLQQGLHASGLKVQDLHCFCGAPPKPRGQVTPKGMVNIKV